VRATIAGGGILTFIYYESWRDCELRYSYTLMLRKRPNVETSGVRFSVAVTMMFYLFLFLVHTPGLGTFQNYSPWNHWQVQQCTKVTNIDAKTTWVIDLARPGRSVTRSLPSYRSIDQLNWTTCVCIPCRRAIGGIWRQSRTTVNTPNF
jgi:hypothetical protein